MGTEALNRDSPETRQKPPYEFPPFLLDPAEGVLVRDGVPVEITPKAAAVLRVLVEHHGEIVGKEKLMEEVWRDVSVGEANLPTQILTLRRALGEFGSQYIQTVPGRGYRFSAPVIKTLSAERTQPAPEIREAEQPSPPTEHKPASTEKVAAAPGEAAKKRFPARLPAAWIVAAALFMAFIAVTLLAYHAWSVRAPAAPIAETLFPGIVREGPRVLTTIDVPAGVDKLLLNPDDRQLYAARQAGNSVSVIDTRRKTLATVIRVGNNPTALAITPDGSRVYVGLLGGNVSVIDVASHRVTSIGTSPVQDLAITPDGRTLYLALGYDGVRKIDLKTNRASRCHPLSTPGRLRLPLKATDCMSVIKRVGQAARGGTMP